MAEIPSKTGDAEPMADRERGILKLGYMAMLGERYPINTNTAECSTPESAVFLAIEKEFMEVPQSIYFDALRDSIPKEQHGRMETIWNTVVEKRRIFRECARVLKTKWKYAPESSDLLAEDIVTNTRIIRAQLKNVARAMISKVEMPENEDDELSSLSLWKREEKGVRQQFYEADKNYLVALRLYYEMLLEKPGEKTAAMPILPEDHPQRWEIVLRNRYARLIDATHQGVSMAKAAHHGQSGRRIRKSKEEPFVFHPLAVSMRFIQDVIPYIIEEKKLSMDYILGIILTSVHDLAEDTDLTIEDIIEFLRTRADKYDSTVDQVIASGYGRSREDIKRKQLDLLRPHVLNALRTGLRMVTNDTNFSDADRKYALGRNRLGQNRTREILGLDRSGWSSLLRRFQLPLISDERTLRAVSRFPNTHAGQKDTRKLDMLLLRIDTFGRTEKKGEHEEISSKGIERQRIALCAKLEDRAHNNSQLKGRAPEIQRSSLRVTVSRLIAFAMLDFDAEGAALFNSLPRLIDETILEYERFFGEFPEYEEDIDSQYIGELKQWSSTVKRWPPPTFVRNVLDEWEVNRK